ncbi:MAG: molybdate ABC transporter permease subunit, partial [Collinsella sp.]
DEQGPLTSLASFLGDIDYRPFWVSIKTSGLALLISFTLGLFAAWRTMGTTSRIKGLLDSVFTIPMVLPPTVCGFLLLMLFGRSTGVGQWLIAHGVSIVFTWPAAVISAVVVSFPLVYVRHSEPSRASTRRCSMRRARWAGPNVASLPSL